MTVYRVTKRGQANWFRLQQLVPLRTGTTYTVSAWVLDDGPQQAGIQGWAQLTNGTVFALTTRLVDHKIVVGLNGPGKIDSYGIAATYRAWKRVYATFSYDGSQTAIDWSVGLAPDARDVADTSASFAGFQLERGPLTPYQAGPATRGLGFTAGRLAMWRVAWQGIRERPWLGWGASAFPGFFQRSTSNVADGEVPAHAHDLLLEVLFERGIVGLASLLLLLVGLTWAALRTRDWGLLIVFAAVLLANVFDYTLFFGGVIYPLAAVAGWRSGEGTDLRPATDSLSRQFLVRLVLAGVDVGLAWVAYSLSSWLLPHLGLPLAIRSGNGELALYALFLWPAMAWREGLYPGYGLTEPDELKRQILSSTYAGALFLIGTLVFRGDLGIDPMLIVVTTVIAYALLPIGRGAAKRVLRSLGLWGRPVLILGGGAAAANIARILHHRSLDGLRPVGIFSDEERAGADLDASGRQHTAPRARCRGKRVCPP